MSILVVEDDPDVAAWVAHCVRDPEREVRTVRDATATRALESFEPDLVLLDYDLPGQDGVDLLAELRTRWPGVACVFVTVQWTGEILARIASTGAERVTKPFERDVLLAAVDRALAG